MCITHNVLVDHLALGVTESRTPLAKRMLTLQRPSVERKQYPKRELLKVSSAEFVWNSQSHARRKRLLSRSSANTKMKLAIRIVPTCA